MFGGIGYIVNGNMARAILDDYMIVRVGKEAYDDALNQIGVSEFLNNGHPMRGWVIVNASILNDDKALRVWLEKGVDFALTLPKK